MSDAVSYCEGYVKPRWWNDPTFPLVPRLDVRPARASQCNGDSGTPKNFLFAWLFFKCWSLDHLALEIGLVCDSHWGIGIIGIAPYLRWTLCVPFPQRWYSAFYKATNRKP